jgi:hypothetical protein
MTPLGRLSFLLFATAVAVGCPAGQSGGPAGPTPSPAAGSAGTSDPTPTPSPSGTPYQAELGSKKSLAFTAVEFGTADDVVALVRNLSSSSIDLVFDRWKLEGNGKFGKLSAAGTASIPAGAEVRVHVNAPGSCTESASVWCAEVAVGVTQLKGNLALFKGVDTGADANPSNIVDFVEWGAGGQNFETLATDAKLWQENAKVDVSTDSASISVKVPGASGYENWR